MKFFTWWICGTTSGLNHCVAGSTTVSPLFCLLVYISCVDSNDSLYHRQVDETMSLIIMSVSWIFTFLSSPLSLTFVELFELSQSNEDHHYIDHCRTFTRCGDFGWRTASPVSHGSLLINDVIVPRNFSGGVCG